ncbi:STE20-related kinase adapter protein alpha [Asbolus verrucosus]|uniref:STE20-related kinase adapter protein alpha n=1 Tax=Asbolus verrucosus TaxID=1661398 RepID=A0A482VEW8_ASBVE|nr:STE20-related kinase adapter protein alpha [Asbolus verrucosus]
MINYEAGISSYETISTLGQCFEGMAVVHLARHLPSGTMVAVKRFNMDRIKHEAHLVEREIILTKQLQHPNIITYHVAFVHLQEVCVVSPLMAFGSCRDLLNTHFNEGLPEQAIVLILRDLLDASVRAGHILISASGKACLAGLRYACPIVLNGKWQKHIHSFPGSTSRNLNWLSPELLEQNLQGYNQKSDIYSVGMVICELANGAEPFAGVSTTLMLTEKVRGCVPQLLDCTTVSTDENNECHGDCDISNNVVSRRFTEDLHELATLCLQKEAIIRPTASQLLTHPIFKLTKKGLFLPDLLKPAMPLSNRVAVNTDEVTNLDVIQQLSDMEVYSCEWDF